MRLPRLPRFAASRNAPWPHPLRTGRLVLALVAAVALLLAACSGGQPAAPAQPAPAAAPAAPAAAAPPPPPPTADRLVPGFKMLVNAPSHNTEANEVGKILVEELKKIGLRPEMVTYPSFNAYTDLWKKTPDWGLGFSGYTTREDRLDPDEFLKYWTCAEAKDKGRNEANYCSPEFDKEYSTQAELFDPNQRKPAVLKAQEILARDLPVLAQFHPELRHVYNQEKYGDVISMPGIGTWSTINFIQARPLTADKVFKAGLVGSLPALNPMADNFAGTDQDIVRLIFDTLTRAGKDGTPLPWAAEKWNQVNPKTLDLTLRAGMKFHDGNPVTVDDVVFTINLFLKEKPAFYVAYTRPLDKAEKVSDNTVRLLLKEPYAPLLLSTLGRLPILPKHIWEKINDPRKASNAPLIGSGPYKAKAINVEQSYRLERFAGHFGQPQSEEVTITKFANKETQYLSLAKGETFFHEQKGLQSEQLVEATKQKHLKVVQEPSIEVRYMVYNLRDKSPFQDYPLREAVAHLLDYKIIEEIITKGMAQRGRGLIAPANKFWHNAGLPAQEGSGVHHHQYDPAKAKKILQDAGYQWDKDGKLYFPANHKPRLLNK